ncbi:hypothetical protein ROHU_029070 [Labeo rohita]|uniref:Uncharacterized protein n=1 Tax=Labeo rohita TaxID=84645 RepID=A0A498LVB5_LABRO|nr:hypothetical protein ROHU_030269 [Labeo rohita]RXN13311.1 hypothetical protein ROHU_029070 [Labeo rohita]
MSDRDALKVDEGLMMMQELEDRLKEHTDKLEHVRLAAADLRDALSGVRFSVLITSNDDMQQFISEHMEWLAQLTDRVETLQMNTTVFVQMNAKPRSFRVKQQGLRSSGRWGRCHVTDDAQSEYGWSPVRTRRNSDAASEMSCAW